jgi:hypothetical protein
VLELPLPTLLMDDISLELHFKARRSPTRK